MSQNVPVKKIQVEERRKKVSELYLKNMSITKLSEMFGVDRKTIQRDLRQVKFSFVQSRPSEEMYEMAVHGLSQHTLLYHRAMEAYNRTYNPKRKFLYLKLLHDMWSSKYSLLVKIGFFDALPSMIDKEHNLGAEVTKILLET